ncbi:pilus (MSHA type) biogenesis protein MshL [Desulfonauticus submarinus]
MLKKMKKINILLTICAAILFACSPPKSKLDSREVYKKLYQKIKTEDAYIKAIRKQEQEGLEKIQKKKSLKIEPVLPQFNPLETTLISISVRNKPLSDVLYVIARNAGLNLIIDPQINTDMLVTLSFENTSSAIVLEKLLQAYDLAWEVKENVLFIKRYQTKMFKLDFLNLQTSVKISNGGDIFGAASNDSSTDITGEFSLKSSLGNGIEKKSLYNFVAKSIAQIIGQSSSTSTKNQEEYFNIDPIAGFLFVKTTPSKMKAIAKFIYKLKEKMNKQVVIDARILEITLKDEFQFGIDWNYVTTRLMSGTTYDITTGYSSGTGILPITIKTNPESKNPNYSRESTIASAINALTTFGKIKVISNPHVRTRHGQPALFTCGTTQKYVDSITKEDSGESTSYTIDVKSVFDGILLGVVPFIKDDDTVDLQIFPIKSQVNPDSLRLQTVTEDGTKISLPQIEIKNVSTNVVVGNNDTIILGGLIDKNNSKNDGEVPGLGKVPVVGWLFKKKNHVNQIKELVIIMTIKII